MRLTGLGQYAKGLAHHNPIEAAALQDRLERIQWRLWGIVNLLSGSRGLGEFDGEQGCCGLCGQRDAADVVPCLEGAGALGAVVGCRHQVARQEEEVVDLIVGG
jgi:hypothetical protein